MSANSVTGVIVHDPELCEGRPCCFHNPSDHALKDASWHIRFDNPIYKGGRVHYLTERTCEHDVGHPDPDSVAYLIEVLGQEQGSAWGVHGCDGCCSGKQGPWSVKGE